MAFQIRRSSSFEVPGRAPLLALIRVDDRIGERQTLPHGPREACRQREPDTVCGGAHRKPCRSCQAVQPRHEGDRLNRHRVQRSGIFPKVPNDLVSGSRARAGYCSKNRSAKVPKVSSERCTFSRFSEAGSPPRRTLACSSPAISRARASLIAAACPRTNRRVRPPILY